MGQTLHYIGWVKENLAEKEQEVRGIIVAKEITEGLRLSLRYTPFNVSLREYSLSFSVKEVI